MVSRGFTVFLALLRIAAGISLILAGLTKLSWFQSPAALQQTLAKWSAGAASPMVARYLAIVTPHAGLFARMVVLGELGLGALLLVGFLTPLAALLAFLMVLNFSVASSQILGKQFYAAPGSLVYLLSFLVIFAGKGGTALGVDGILSGRKQRAN
jgi:uncharacterized membrane protein YphA (DoxX/SURF4 family)